MITDPESWRGAFYELAIEVSVRRDDHLLAEALNSLLLNPFVHGPWNHWKEIGISATTVVDATADTRPLGYLLVDIPGMGALGAYVTVVRERNGSDWLDICVPLGMLERVVCVKHPMTRNGNPWMSTVDERLGAIADDVCSRSPFDLALIGEEVSGSTTASDLDPSAIGNALMLLSDGLKERVGLELSTRKLPTELLNRCYRPK